MSNKLNKNYGKSMNGQSSGIDDPKLVIFELLNGLNNKLQYTITCLDKGKGDEAKESAKKAQNDGANYVAFGPAFKSKTKNKKKISLNNLIKKRMEISLPFTIIGGINHKNFVKLRELRPDYVAIINSLWNFKAGPIESAKLFKKLMFIGDLNHENQCKLT